MNIVVMFSGGADSMLTLLTAIEEHGKEKVTAVYVNLIGQAIPPEVDFAVSTMQSLGIRWIKHDREVLDFGKGPEGNARMVLKHVINSYAAPDTEVWLGHTMDDHIETVMIQLFRGAGVGTRGIPDKRQGMLYRPLLDMTRAEVREKLVQKGMKWYDDPMNLNPNLARVFFREKIIPLLKEHYGNGVYKRINTIAEKLGGRNED